MQDRTTEDAGTYGPGWRAQFRRWSKDDLIDVLAEHLRACHRPIIFGNFTIDCGLDVGGGRLTAAGTGGGNGRYLTLVFKLADAAASGAGGSVDEALERGARLVAWCTGDKIAQLEQACGKPLPVFPAAPEAGRARQMALRWHVMRFVAGKYPAAYTADAISMRLADETPPVAACPDDLADVLESL